MNTSTLTILREEKTIIMSRVFDATPERVWRVCTDPNLIPKWWGPRSVTTIVDKMDVRVGGEWRYIHKDGDGNEYAFRGEYKVVDPPKLLVNTFEFEPMAGHIVTDAHHFEALPDGKTRLTTQSTCDTLEDLEGILQSGMEGGANESWDRLEEVLTTL